MKSIYLVTVVLWLVVSNAFAWNDEKTHPTISGKVATAFFGESFVKQEINNKMAIDWIKGGSILEDTGSVAQFIYNGTARSLSHFHNASKSTLIEAKLNDLPSYLPIVGARTWESTLLWAQDGDNQKTKVGGDWSWKMVRDLYYKSLTTTDKAVRDLWQADYLKGLGYQMHLIQDMGQPNHVRNDTHVWDGASWVMGLETWARKKDDRMLDILNSTTIPAVTVDLKVPFGPEAPDKEPIARLFDTRMYKGTRQPTATFDQGLAEYTNSNFFSENTIFSSEYPIDDKHYQPYPRKSETNVQDYIDNLMSLTTVTTDDDFGPFDSFIITKQATTGEKLNCLAAAGPFSRKIYQEQGENKNFYRSFLYDTCFPEYAAKLIPASAAYSKAMLEYFHRGKLSVSPAAPGTISFRSVKLTASNNTPGEAMGLGDVSLVIRYKPLNETGTGPVMILENPSTDYVYKVAKLQDVDLSNPHELTFDFSSEALPLYFGDISMQLVYRGPLGNEADAVATSPIMAIDGVYTDFTLSLPPSGVYAASNSNTPSATFNELHVNALTNIPGGLTGGRFELQLEYRLATSNPFFGLPGTTAPDNAYAYVFKTGVTNGVTSLAQGTQTELVFDLSTAPLSVLATDVELNLVYIDNAIQKPVAIGFRDISEATPIDLFNNTDFVCISNSWYAAGSPEARAAADQAGNHNGLDDDTDTFHHDFTNIYLKLSPIDNQVRASVTSYNFLDPGPVQPASMQRIGFVLTDPTFSTSFLPNWVHVEYPQDAWTRTESATLDNATAVRISTGSDGAFLPLPMYNMRGRLMWGNAASVYDNTKLPANSICDWGALPTAP